MTTDTGMVMGKDYCTACGDPVSAVGPMNAEGDCAPCVRRRTTFAWGQRDGAAAALGAVVAVLTNTHTHDEIRKMVDAALAGEAPGLFADSTPLSGGYEFSPAEWFRDTPEYAQRRLAEWADDDPDKARYFVESFEKRVCGNEAAA